MNISRKTNGFTLVEIVVVIGIMAFLTAIIYSSFDASKAQSRDQKRVSDISTIQLGLEQYFQKNALYPVELKDASTTISQDLITTYGSSYFPMTKNSGSTNCITYQLWVKFERNNVYLNSKKGFDSTLSILPHNLSECGSGHMTENAFIDPLVYDVMP